MSSEMKAGFKRTSAGIVPNDWSTATIKDIGFTSSGTTPSRSQFERYFRGGKINWVKTLDLNNSWIYATEEQVTATAIEETSLRVYSPGTVLVAMYGGFNQIGRTGFLKVPACVNQAITAIQCREALRPEYLLATLNFRSEYWKSVASSSRKDPNITSTDIRDFPIAYPGQHEQASISAALSDMDALISGLDQLIAKKRDIKQAAMQQLLTGQTRLPGFSGEWEVKRLGDMASLRRENVIPENNGDQIYTHFSLPAFDLGKEPMIEAGSEIGSNKFRVPQDAVLVSKLNPRIPRVWAPDNIPEHSVASTEFLVLVAKGGVSRRFLFTVCASPIFCDRMEGEATGTTGSHQRISPAGALNIEVMVPVDIEEQAVIADILFDMDAELATLEARRDKAKQLKQGMMQELLTGRIRLV